MSVESDIPVAPGEPRFRERPTEALVPDAYRFAAVPLGAALLFALLGWSIAAWVAAGLGLFVVAFFRNPRRSGPTDADAVIAPADGLVIDVSEVEDAAGTKQLRIGIFLSVFDVHVNRAPVAGRVVSIDRSGDAYLAAFDPKAESRNVRCDLTLETEEGVRVRVCQITGLIARRIVCHPQVGEWLERGTRYGLIRFGSRTDVWLPIDAEAQVTRGQRVWGGHTLIARMPTGAMGVMQSSEAAA